MATSLNYFNIFVWEIIFSVSLSDWMDQTTTLPMSVFSCSLVVFPVVLYPFASSNTTSSAHHIIYSSVIGFFFSKSTVRVIQLLIYCTYFWSMCTQKTWTLISSTNPTVLLLRVFVDRFHPTCTVCPLRPLVNRDSVANLVWPYADLGTTLHLPAATRRCSLW